MSLIRFAPFQGVLNAKLKPEAPGNALPSTKATTIAQARATVVATTIATVAAAADATDTVRRICPAPQAITMPGRTARTTGGCVITKDLQAAAAATTTTQGADLGHLLGDFLGIAMGIAIEIKIEMEAVAGRKSRQGPPPAVR